LTNPRTDARHGENLQREPTNIGPQPRRASRYATSRWSSPQGQRDVAQPPYVGLAWPFAARVVQHRPRGRYVAAATPERRPAHGAVAAGHQATASQRYAALRIAAAFAAVYRRLSRRRCGRIGSPCRRATGLATRVITLEDALLPVVGMWAGGLPPPPGRAREPAYVRAVSTGSCGARRWRPSEDHGRYRCPARSTCAATRGSSSGSARQGP
jgi:hypothetical protein